MPYLVRVERWCWMGHVKGENWRYMSRVKRENWHCRSCVKRENWYWEIRVKSENWRCRSGVHEENIAWIISIPQEPCEERELTLQELCKERELTSQESCKERELTLPGSCKKRGLMLRDSCKQRELTLHESCSWRGYSLDYIFHGRMLSLLWQLMLYTTDSVIHYIYHRNTNSISGYCSSNFIMTSCSTHSQQRHLESASTVVCGNTSLQCYQWPRQQQVTTAAATSNHRCGNI